MTPAQIGDETKMEWLDMSEVDDPTVFDPQQIVTRYFELADTDPLGDEMMSLFDEDIEFYFPKYGVSRGWDGFRAFVEGMGQHYQSVSHHADEFQRLACGDSIVVEGTTEGSRIGGGTWDGGKTPGGRFCSIFEIDSVGQRIRRVYIYLDPDYVGRHVADFIWPDTPKREW